MASERERVKVGERMIDIEKTRGKEAEKGREGRDICIWMHKASHIDWAIYVCMNRQTESSMSRQPEICVYPYLYNTIYVP